MSSVRASGLYSRASARAVAPSEVTSPLKPFSRAASRRKRAKPVSFSTISKTRSPGRILSRSSPTSLTIGDAFNSEALSTPTAVAREKLGADAKANAAAGPYDGWLPSRPGSVVAELGTLNAACSPAFPRKGIPVFWRRFASDSPSPSPARISCTAGAGLRISRGGE